MKTKKITALVLAALMAAGTTATAFADSDVVNRGGDLDDSVPLLSMMRPSMKMRTAF